MVAGTTGLPAAGPPGAVEGGGATMAAGTIGLPAARPHGAAEGGGGGIMAAGNVGPPGAGGGGGITMGASTTGLSGSGSAGGIDGIGTSWHRAGISAGFSAGGATLTSAAGFGLGAVFLRRRFGWEAQVLLFETLHQLDHPPLRKTSQLGELRHFYLAPGKVRRLRTWCRDQLDQHAIQSGFCRRHDSQKELRVSLRHLLSTFPDLNGSGS
jgi:hypothetical protein